MRKLRTLLMATLALLIATPAVAQEMTKGELPGIYVLCPRKNPERCPVAVEEFRYYFPNEQTAPYMMLRKDGTGFWAYNMERTQDVSWVQDEKGLLVLNFSGLDSKISKFKVNGSLLKDATEGDVYYMAITDREWNNPPKKKPGVRR